MKKQKEKSPKKRPGWADKKYPKKGTPEYRKLCEEADRGYTERGVTPNAKVLG